MKEQLYFSRPKFYERERERELAPPNQMSLRPSPLWLTLNLALIIQCLSRLFFVLNTPQDIFAYSLICGHPVV
jgi:hypothetical protein